MSGFYKKIKKAWNNIKDALTPTRKELNPYDELCSRFSTEDPIKTSEFNHLERLCKLISEPSCEKKIGDRFSILKEIAEDRARIGKMDGNGSLEGGDMKKIVKKKRRRNVSRVKNGEINAEVKTPENIEESEEKEIVKRHRKQGKGYQRKYALRKENDVSWGVLPKKYRTEGKTPMDVLEKAISYEEKEDNLFLHLGEVSSDEEEAYFSEDNVNRLNKEDSMKLKPIRCNFGDEYNCRNCMEYEIRKEYEARERKGIEKEEERSRLRRRIARERWEAKMPKSYFYLEKDMGIDRLITRYVTDDNFSLDDLEDDEKEKLTAILDQPKRKQLFDIDNIGSKRKTVSFDEDKNEISEIPVVRTNSVLSDGIGKEKKSTAEFERTPGTLSIHDNERGFSSAPKSEHATPRLPFVFKPGDSSNEEKEVKSSNVNMNFDTKSSNSNNQAGVRTPFIFGGSAPITQSSVSEDKDQSPAIDKDNKLVDGSISRDRNEAIIPQDGLNLGKSHPTFPFGTSDEAKKIPEERGDKAIERGFDGGSEKDTKTSSSGVQNPFYTVNYGNISSPFTSSQNTSEAKPFSFGGPETTATPSGSYSNGASGSLFGFSNPASGNAPNFTSSGFGQSLKHDSEPKFPKSIDNLASSSGASLFKRKLDQPAEASTNHSVSNEYGVTSGVTKQDQIGSASPSSIGKESSQFSFLSQPVVFPDNSNSHFNSTNASFQASPPFTFGAQQAKDQNFFNTLPAQSGFGEDGNTSAVNFPPSGIANQFGAAGTSSIFSGNEPTGKQHMYYGYQNTPQQFGFTGNSTDIFSTQKNNGNFQLGTGKNLFGGLFEDNDTSSQPAKPSIGYNISKEENQNSTGGIFGGSIFKTTEEDPFERPNRPNRKK